VPRHQLNGRRSKGKLRVSDVFVCDRMSMSINVQQQHFWLNKCRKSKILSETNQYPDNKLLTEQEQVTEGNGEKSDESSEKYVIEKPEDDEKNEYDDEDDGKRDDSEKTLRVDKKIDICGLPPGWEKHEGSFS
jgi:hypothetical protein